MVWVIWIGCGLLIVIAMLGVLLWVLGRALPEEHLVCCEVRIGRPAAEVFGAIDDTSSWPTWDKGVTTVEKLEPREGRERVRMHMGRNVMVLETTRREAPTLLEKTIAEEGRRQMFSGRWMHELRDEGGACVVRLSEHGKIHQAIPRAMVRYFFDPAMYLKKHLTLLAKKFGEEAKVEVVRV